MKNSISLSVQDCPGAGDLTGGNNQADELYLSIDRHLAEDDKPSGYLQSIYGLPLLQSYPFRMLHQLRETDQSPRHHPEGNVWNHTLLVVDGAAAIKSKSRNPRVFMWAALLHDIGKPAATKRRNGKLTAYNHDSIGAGLAEEFLRNFKEERKFIREVTVLVRYHMQILFAVKNPSLADIKKMKQETDVREIALLGLCDRLGRTNIDKLTEENNVRQFLNQCGVPIAQVFDKDLNKRINS